MREAERATSAATPSAEVTSEANWSVMRLLTWSAEYLTGKGVEGARLDAELLLGRALGLSRLDLYLQHDRLVTPSERDRFRPLLRRRAAREPLQYILGDTDFRTLTLAVDRRALIPRPETEELVGAVLAWAESRELAPESRTAADVGTGCGCIALSLAVEGGFLVFALEQSAEAIELATENAERAGAAARLELRRGDLLEPLEGRRVRVIVANAPYVAEHERGALEPEVRAWEPDEALFAGEDGMDAIRRLVGMSPDHLEPGGLLALEVGSDQAEAVADLIRSLGVFRDPSILDDLAGRPRIVLAELDSPSAETQPGSEAS